jgi:hypothetical protein
MKKNEEDLYNIDKYKDEDLYNMLDMNNPTDRELEAKIVIMINKYSEMEGEDAKKLKSFFEQVYDRFFDDEEDDESRVIELDGENIEGFEGMDKNPSSQKDTFSDYKNVFGKNEVTDKTEDDKKLLQTTPLFYGASKLNPLLKETQKRVLQLDSQFRNYDNYPTSTDYIINLSEHLHNVVSLRLHSVSIPYTWYNVSNVYDANYFKLLGNVDGIKGVYDLTFNIPSGTYNTIQLMDAINNSITEVAANNTDIEFGTTGVSYNELTSKITFTLDIQQVYNETNYYIYFNYYTSPFDTSTSIDAITGNQQTQSIRQLSIPGFLGFGNLVIPKYSNSNFVQSQPLTEVDNTYSMESIYSLYEYCYNVTGKETPEGDPIEYNSFDPNQMFYLVINDASNNVVGNNYFTIQTFDGPNPYDASSTLIDTINVEFGDVSGFYTRATLLESINRSLANNEFLSSNASLNQIDISYSEVTNADNYVVTMQRFQLRTLLNRQTTTKKRNAKQIVLFPDEIDVYNALPSNVKINWPGPIWTGQSSCFMFYDDNKFWQSNAVPSEIGHLRTKYLLESNPTITLRCMKDYPVYDNAANNRTIQIPTSDQAGFPDGYKLMDYFGVYSYDNVNNEKIYQFSEINSRFDTINNTLNNGYVDVEAFYDVGRARCRVQVDINTYFNETMYTFDLSNFFLNDIDGSGNALGVFTLTNDTSYNFVNGINTDQPTDTGLQVTSTTMNIPSGSNNELLNAIHNNTNSFGTTNFPFAITSQNNRIVVDVSNAIPGLAGVQTAWGGTGYTIYIPEKKYAQPYLLVNAINNAFAQIQGDTDPSGNKLYGLNMSRSKFYMSDVDGSTEYNWVLQLVVSNNLSENNYQLEFADSKTDYENPWIDANENYRYSLDSSGNLVTSAEPALTGTSWNAFLGFTDVSYSLIPPSTLDVSGVNRTGPTGTEIVASRDIMNDISGSIFIYESDIADAEGTVSYYQNNLVSFLPQTNVKGLVDASGIKRLEIAIDGGIYTYYGLLNALNSQLQLVPETVGSIIYNYFSNVNDNDYTVFQMNINKVYTAQDYILEFYDEEEVAISDKVRNITSSNSFQAITWDVTLGWMLGYRTFPSINLNATDVSNSQYVDIQSYSLDASTGIITLVGDTGLDLYLYKTLYLILDDFTQNHLNDGLITGVRDNALANKPSYSSTATKVCNPITKRDQTSIFSASQPGMGLTENQLYAANTIAENNFVRQTTRLYSDPPYVKDMFATIPIKVSSLKQGDLFTEFGGTLQDNDRKYFGPVNISKMNIKLLNDHGDVIDLNGNNWSFSLVFEYLYNLKGI